MNLRNLVPWKHKEHESDTANVPAHPVERMRWELDQVLGRFFQDAWTTNFWSEEQGWTPTLDVKETSDAVVVRAELPGVDPKDLDITVTGDLLTLQGKKEERTEQKDENWFRTECRYGQFRRSILLPEGVDAENVQADFKHGVLSIELKKTADAQAKRIPIKGS